MVKLFVRCLAAAAAGLAVATTAATPAQAAPTGLSFQIRDTELREGTTAWLDYGIGTHELGAVFSDPTMTYRLSGEIDGLRLKAGNGGSECDNPTPAELVCRIDKRFDLPKETEFPVFGAQIVAGEGTAGQDVTITGVLSATGLDDLTASAHIIVTQGVDLAADGNIDASAGLGAEIPFPVRVSNASDVVVRGAAVLVRTGYPLVATEEYSNCFYGGTPSRPNVCVFDRDLRPGGVYEVVLPYRVRQESLAPQDTENRAGWLTTGAYQDWLKGLDGRRDTRRPGRGGVLELREVEPGRTGERSAAKQVDVNDRNDWQVQKIRVTGRQSTDLEALGATVRGAEGRKLTVSVGIRNNGPAALATESAGPHQAVAIVTFPAGAKVTATPQNCALLWADDPRRTKKDVPQYLCHTAAVFNPGRTTRWRFEVTAGEAVEGGTVEVNPKLDPGCFECGWFLDDTDPSNNVAAIAFNGKAEPAADGDHGGGLPITGPGVGLGVLLVAAGAAALLIRRRRTRFEA